MDIGKPLRVIHIDLPTEQPAAIPLPAENPFKPEEKPVENWPIRVPVPTPAENA